MTLYEKIIAIYPQLVSVDSSDDTFRTVIRLQNDTGHEGDDYIAVWNHPTLAQPTQEQLDAVGEE